MPKLTIQKETNNYESQEAYKVLRTNLQFCGDDKKVIVFTSCTPDEGKSTVVRRLAESLAEGGKRVLLLDGDLRKSVMAGYFSVNEPIKGLTHLLSGQSVVSDTVCTTDLKNLDVILAGPVPPNPAELLGSQRFELLLDWAKPKYDYVLIDSAPLGAVIDSAIVAKHCDGAVIIVETEVISYRFVQEIKEQLERAGCPVLGAILNKVDIQSHRYYNRYYGKYGKRYGRYYGKYYGYGQKGDKGRK